jgi:transcriptional regulator with XRE-family HTH domain
MSYAGSETAWQVRAALGGVLRRLRESLGRSLQEVGNAASVSPAFLSEVERGRKEISIEKLVAVSQALETTAADVYRELARELGAGEPTWAVAYEADPRAQLRRMAQSLDSETLRTVTSFTSFLAAAEPARPKRGVAFRPLPAPSHTRPRPR